jgi:hypothetical protein
MTTRGVVHRVFATPFGPPFQPDHLPFQLVVVQEGGGP